MEPLNIAMLRLILNEAVHVIPITIRTISITGETFMERRLDLPLRSSGSNLRLGLISNSISDIKGANNGENTHHWCHLARILLSKRLFFPRKSLLAPMHTGASRQKSSPLPTATSSFLNTRLFTLSPAPPFHHNHRVPFVKRRRPSCALTSNPSSLPVSRAFFPFLARRDIWPPSLLPFSFPFRPLPRQFGEML